MFRRLLVTVAVLIVGSPTRERHPRAPIGVDDLCRSLDHRFELARAFAGGGRAAGRCKRRARRCRHCSTRSATKTRRCAGCRRRSRRDRRAERRQGARSERSKRDSSAFVRNKRWPPLALAVDSRHRRLRTARTEATARLHVEVGGIGVKGGAHGSPEMTIRLQRIHHSRAVAHKTPGIDARGQAR